MLWSTSRAGNDPTDRANFEDYRQCSPDRDEQLAGDLYRRKFGQPETKREHSSSEGCQIDTDCFDCSGRGKCVPANRSLISSALLSDGDISRSEEHTSELQSLMRISYSVFCLKKKKTTNTHHQYYNVQTQTNI